jgi:hypothetical protein
MRFELNGASILHYKTKYSYSILAQLWLAEVIPSCLSDVRQCQIVDNMHYESDFGYGLTQAKGCGYHA